MRNKRKKRIIILVLLLMFLLIRNFASYGYYNNSSSISLFESVVGNPYDSYDFVLLINVKNANNEYVYIEEIPDYGYSYTGFNCLNNSSIYYDDENNLINVDIYNKDICNVYFDLTN